MRNVEIEFDPIKTSVRRRQVSRWESKKNGCDKQVWIYTTPTVEN
jgi:hypothetical protein